MKSLLCVLGMVALALLHSAASAATLTQQEVIQLLQLKTPEAEIIDQIKSGGTKFTLGAEDIARLKRAGATPAILAAMQGGGAVGPDLATAEISDLCLVVDYSRSMSEKTADGTPKMTAAKQAVVKLIDALPSDLNVAVVVYGTKQDRGCEDIDLIHPLGKLDKEAIKKRLISLPNTGYTPIASALNIAGLSLKKATAGRAIVLVTDGVESCKGEPAKVAAKLAAEFGVKFGLHVVGFDIKPEERASLAAISKAGNGQYFNAKSAVEFATAMQKVTEVVAEAAAEPAAEPVVAAGASAPIMVFVERGYSWENPLHSEFIVNGKTVDIFSSDTRKDITKHLKKGWNSIAMTTRVQEPASESNSLTFRIGPVNKDSKTGKLTMDPVLWRFDNGTDWTYNNGKYSHRARSEHKGSHGNARVVLVGHEPRKPADEGGRLRARRKAHLLWMELAGERHSLCQRNAAQQLHASGSADRCHILAQRGQKRSPHRLSPCEKHVHGQRHHFLAGRPGRMGDRGEEIRGQTHR